MTDTDFSEEQLEEALDRLGVIRQLLVLHLAFPLGVAAFATVVAFLFFTGEPPADDELLPLYPITLLSAIHVALALGTWTLGCFLFTRLSKPRALNAEEIGRLSSRDAEYLKNPAACWLLALRGPYIMRLALFEGPALLGVVICFLAVESGEMHEEPWIWANLSSGLVLAMFSLATYPTCERLLAMYRQQRHA